MKRRVLTCAPLLALIIICGCHKGFSSKQAKERLVGTYHLAGKAGEGCAASGVKSSTLVLRSDGTYDQHVEFASGEALDEVRQRWNYDGGVHFSNLRITAIGELHKYAPETEASLLVELSHPVIIFLDPSSECFYSQPK
jgi:hypothetical protein